MYILWEGGVLIKGNLGFCYIYLETTWKWSHNVGFSLGCILQELGFQELLDDRLQTGGQWRNICLNHGPCSKKGYISSIEILLLICQKLIEHICVGLFLGPLSVPLVYVSVSPPVPHCYAYCSYMVSLNIKKNDLSLYYPFSKIFRINSFMSTKKFAEILV